jgi:hypothetical protein
MHAIVAVSAHQMLMRPEVANVVSNLHQETAIDSGLVKTSEQGHQLANLVRLQQQ